MSIHSLKAITPIDGRYASKTSSLISYFSEEALIKYRVQVEIEYFIALVELKLPQLSGFGNEIFGYNNALSTFNEWQQFTVDLSSFSTSSIERFVLFFAVT